MYDGLEALKATERSELRTLPELRGDVIRKFDGFEPSADPCGGKSAEVRIFHYSIHFKLIQLPVGFVIPIRPSYLRMNALNCEDMLWILLI